MADSSSRCRARGIEVDTEPIEDCRSVGSEFIRMARDRSRQPVSVATLSGGDAVGGHEGLLCQERAGDSDAELSGEVVVAGAGGAQSVSVGALPQRPHRHGRGDGSHGFQHGSHIPVGEAVVAVSSGGFDGDQSRREEAC